MKDYNFHYWNLGYDDFKKTVYDNRNVPETYRKDYDEGWNCGLENNADIKKNVKADVHAS